MEKLLTIVVPTYNEEKFLETNLRSFCIPGLLPELEILIVNDGSMDGSLQIAEKYCEDYPDSYRVITKENGGHGSCINTGIKNAFGRYFKVVDADDWVVEDGFGELVNFLRTASSDIVYSEFLWAYDKGENDVNAFKTEAEFDEPFQGVEYCREYRFDDVAEKCYLKMHNLTIRTSILKQIPPIDEHCYYVDYEYITYPIPEVETITFMDCSVYRYRIGTKGQSVDIDQMIRHSEDVDKVLNSLFEFFDTLGGSIPCTEPKKTYIAGVIARLIAAKFKILLCEPGSQECKKELQSFDKELKQREPEIYKANQNSAVSMLRASGYLLYGPAAWAAKKQYGAQETL